MANYKPLGTNFDRTFRNDLNENFTTLDGVVSDAVINVDKAVEDSATALTTANSAKTESAQAKTKADDVQTQLNTVIIESGTSDAEVIQARGTAPILKDRLDGVDTQLAENTTKTNYFTTPENFGAKADGTNDSTAFQNAINSFNGKSGKLILDGTKTYSLANTVYIPYNVSVEGNLCLIKPIAGGTFNNNFMFYINVNSSNTTIQGWGGDAISNIQNIKFYNTNAIANIKGFYTRAKTNFRKITFDNFYKGLLKEGSSDQDYSDNITLDTMYFINCLGTEPLVEIKYNGDGLLIDSCHVAGASDRNFNFLSLSFNNGGKIMRCLNGDITINKSTGVSIENHHCEHGKITINSSQVTLRNVYHWYHKTYQPIPLTITQSASDRPTLPSVIENYSVIHIPNRNGNAKDYVEPNYFDAYFKDAKVKVTNFFRRSTMASDQSLGMETGVKLTLDGTTSFVGWDNNNSAFSKESYLVNDKVYSSINEVSCPNNFVSYNPALTNHGSFDEAIGTYYYRAIFYYGYFDRLVGRYGGAEFSANITSPSTQLPLLSFQLRNEMQLAKIRLYRGTSAGSYTHYANIPVGNGMHIYDLGYFIATGERWTPRTAGTIDSYNSSYTKVRLENENMIVYGTAIPTHGTWKVGDKVINTNIAVGQPQGWICSATGTTGTWMALPNY